MKLHFFFWVLAVFLAGCPATNLPDVGPRDVGFEEDASEPDATVILDAEVFPDAMGTRTVNATGFAPALGVGSNDQRSVSGRIPPPTSHGSASSPERTVKGAAGAPR